MGKRLPVLLVAVMVLALGACSPAPLPSPAPAVIPEADAATPEEAILGFYGWAIEYQAYDPTTDTIRNMLVDGAYQDSPYLTDALKVEIEETLLAMVGPGRYDPILCAQDVPTHVWVTDLNEMGDTATATVNTSFQGHSFPVKLERTGDQWQLSAIDCAANAPDASAKPEEPPMPADESGEWLVFRDDQHRFSIHYPAAWQLQEASISDPDAPVQRVITFAPAGWAGMMMPVSVEVSVDQSDPIPDSQPVTVGDYPAFVQESPYGETFTIFEHPEQPGLRIALRDSTGMLGLDETETAELQAVVHQMLESLTLN